MINHSITLQQRYRYITKLDIKKKVIRNHTVGFRSYEEERKPRKWIPHHPVRIQRGYGNKAF